MTSNPFSRDLLDVLIRAGLIALLVLSCYQVFRPFLNLMLWSLILAVTLYPLHRLIRQRLGNSDGRAATLIVALAIGILLIPVYLLGDSMAESIQGAVTLIKSGELHLPPPAESIAGWPLIGQPLYDLWVQATTDLPSLLKPILPHIKDITLPLLGQLAGIGMGFLIFIAALMIAGVIMAFGENGARSSVQIFNRISGEDKGPHLAELCTATIRAVAQGVVGIAFIQMLLIGVGFVMMGVPGAGLLALAVLLLGIMQLPVTLITLPVIGFVFATEGATLGSVLFAIYIFVAGLADNVLKPLLLGRGVAVPMPVVLIGALGGMVTSGIIGLFIGPVMLGLGYSLFWHWVEDPVSSKDSGGA